MTRNILLFLTVGIIFLSFVGVVSAAGFGVTLVNPLAGSGVNDFPTLFTRIAGYLTGLIAALSTIVFVWAGILFVTSAGDPGKVGKAKQAALYAVIGVAISLAATGLLAVITAVVGSGSP